MDDGQNCSVGKYFKYDYASGKVSRSGRLCIDAKESRELSKRVSSFLETLALFGVPIKSVVVSNRNSHFKSHYFYSVGEECILWSDFYADRGRYQKEVGIYIDM